MFISRAYSEKMWTREERRAAMARAMQEKRAYILPIRLDRTELEGLLPSVAFISYSEHSEDKIVNLILEKLDAGNSNRTSAAPSLTLNIAMPKVKKTFTQREKDVFARKAFETIQANFKHGLDQFAQHDSDVEVDFESVHRAKFIGRVYVKADPPHICKIWIGAAHRGSEDRISYYEGGTVSRDRDDQTNDTLTVGSDGHQLGLEAGYGFGSFVGGSGMGNQGRFFSLERAALLFWERFTKSLSAD